MSRKIIHRCLSSECTIWLENDVGELLILTNIGHCLLLSWTTKTNLRKILWNIFEHYY